MFEKPHYVNSSELLSKCFDGRRARVRRRSLVQLRPDFNGPARAVSEYFPLASWLRHRRGADITPGRGGQTHHQVHPLRLVAAGEQQRAGVRQTPRFLDADRRTRDRLPI